MVITSRKPFVAISAVVAPFLSISAFEMRVVAWTTSRTSSALTWSRSRSIPASMANEGSAGVVRTFALAATRPPLIRTRSVKVPPMSTATRAPSPTFVRVRGAMAPYTSSVLALSPRLLGSRASRPWESAALRVRRAPRWSREQEEADQGRGRCGRVDRGDRPFGPPGPSEGVRRSRPGDDLLRPTLQEPELQARQEVPVSLAQSLDQPVAHSIAQPRAGSCGRRRRRHRVRVVRGHVHDLPPALHLRPRGEWR